MKKYRPVILLALLFSASLACSVLQPGASPAPGAVATQVAATFTAMAPGDEAIPTSTAQTGETPADEPTPVPEITPEPAGLRIVYAQNDVIYLWQADQPPKAITGSGGPIYSLEVSDDGRFIAFTRQVGEVQSELWAVNSDGADERVLVTKEDFKSFDPEALAVVPFHFGWVPGSHILAYNTNQIFEGPLPGLYHDLRLVDADTGTQFTLLDPGQGGEFFYSPDGNQIAITTPDKISLMNADGSNLRDAVLEYEPVLTYSEYQYYAQPHWLPDSSGLKVMIPPRDSLSEPRPPTSLWEIPLDGSPAIKTAEIVTMPFFANSTAYSPDLTKIAYLIETGEPAQNVHELHFVNPDGSNDQIYHSGPLLNFRGWAQDSLHFALAEGESQSLQIGQTDEPYTPLADAPTSIFHLRWIDGERYLYVQADEVDATLYLADLSAGPIIIDELANATVPFDFVD